MIPFFFNLLISTDKKNTESKPVKVKRTEAKDAALNSKFNVKAGKTVKVTWGKVKDADGYDVYMAYCGKDKEKVVKSVKAADSLSVEISFFFSCFTYIFADTTCISFRTCCSINMSCFILFFCGVFTRGSMPMGSIIAAPLIPKCVPVFYPFCI